MNLLGKMLELSQPKSGGEIYRSKLNRWNSHRKCVRIIQEQRPSFSRIEKASRNENVQLSVAIGTATGTIRTNQSSFNVPWLIPS